MRTKNEYKFVGKKNSNSTGKIVESKVNVVATVKDGRVTSTPTHIVIL